MENSKNKRHHRKAHRHVFRKRKLHKFKRSSGVQNSIQQPVNTEVRGTAETKCDVPLGGSIIINLDKLQQYTQVS